MPTRTRMTFVAVIPEVFNREHRDADHHQILSFVYSNLSSPHHAHPSQLASSRYLNDDRAGIPVEPTL